MLAIKNTAADNIRGAKFFNPPIAPDGITYQAVHWLNGQDQNYMEDNHANRANGATFKLTPDLGSDLAYVPMGPNRLQMGVTDSQEMTVMCVARELANQQSPSSVFVSNRDSAAGSGRGFRLGIGTAGKVLWTNATTGSGTTTTQGITLPDTSVWTFFAATRTGTALTVHARNAGGTYNDTANPASVTYDLHSGPIAAGATMLASDDADNQLAFALVANGAMAQEDIDAWYTIAQAVMSKWGITI